MVLAGRFPIASARQWLGGRFGQSRRRPSASPMRLEAFVDVAGSAREQGLAQGAIGLREILFQSVTAIGPAAAIAFSIAVAAVYAGGALVLSVLVAMIACLFVASSIGQLS